MPDGVDRRAFMMRSAVVGAAAVITGCAAPSQGTNRVGHHPPEAPASQMSQDLDVVRSQGR
jgi:hypothetical protein